MEWPTFHDLFESLIHNNSSLPPVQKLHYLKSHLSGEAEQLVRHIPITSANYEQCWMQLIKRYNNKRYISSHILNRLIYQKALITESSSGVKHLLDTTSECLSTLTNMGIDVSSWDIIIIHLVTQKLDQESRRQWEQKISDDSDRLPSLSEFLSFLESRFRALEFLEPTIKRDIRNREVTERPRVFSVTTPVTSVPCPFCSDTHMLYQCTRFMQESIQVRQGFVREKRLCFNCLAPYHSALSCKKPTSCKNCNGRHHTLLHQENIYSAFMQTGQATRNDNTMCNLDVDV